MNLNSLNTKAVGFAGVGVLILTALASDDIRNAILAAIVKHDPATIMSCVGVVAAFVLTYYGMPHSVSTSVPPPAPDGVPAPVAVHAVSVPPSAPADATKAA